MQGAGFADVKPLHVTGGMSFELGEPRCKPQVQKTGTIYMPFCADPTSVRLEILRIILPFVGAFDGTSFRICPVYMPASLPTYLPA